MDDLLEYLMDIVPAASIECAGCPKQVAAQTTVLRNGQFYCSDICADIATAPVIKDQPAATKITDAQGVVWEV
jgi:hypothetical protein